jgi:dolichol-phosphate mannosyltransferase
LAWGGGLIGTDAIFSAEEARPGASPIAVSIVIPTYNESKNVPILVERLARALGGLSWEVVFVDDASPDGTADVVRSLARADRRVRLIARHNRRGLSSAVVEGALAAAGDLVAVMDGDLQHDETILPAMIAAVGSGEADIASASRFLRPDGADGLSSAARRKISDTGVMLAQRMFGLTMTDPLTGFFVTRRDLVVDALPHLSEAGFKILLDLVTAREVSPRVKEFPFVFRARIHGESKLDSRAIYDFFIFFIEKALVRLRLPLPGRFVSFALINGVGILIHMVVLLAAFEFAGRSFASAQLLATVVAMAFNYALNNAVTYRDRKLTGARFYVGFLVFSLLCAIGVIGNVSVANVVHRELQGQVVLLPALLGAFITLVWNYVATKMFVWGRMARPRQPRGATVPS